MPVPAIDRDDPLGWVARLSSPRAFAAQADTALEREFRARQLETWVFPAQLAQAAKRNPTYAVDPWSIRAPEAVRRLERSRQATLAEPVASQLRVLVGLENARYALVPVAWHVEPADAGTGRVVMHLAVIDVRAARLHWSGDVRSDTASSPSPSLLASLMANLADLVVGR